MTRGRVPAPADTHRLAHDTLEHITELEAERDKLETVRQGLVRDERSLMLAVAEVKRDCGELIAKLDEERARGSKVEAEIEQAKVQREGLRWEAALLQRRLQSGTLEAEQLERDTAELREKLATERNGYEKAVLDIFRLEQQLRRRG